MVPRPLTTADVDVLLISLPWLHWITLSISHIVTDTNDTLNKTIYVKD